MREKAQRAEAVVDRDEDLALLDERNALIQRLVAEAALEAAAVDPEMHRQVLARRVRRRPDVQVQAVLALRVVQKRVHADEPAVLDAHVAERRAIAHARPGRGRLRRAPAQRAHRRRRVGNAAEHRDAVLLHAGNRAARRLYNANRHDLTSPNTLFFIL